MSRILLLLAFLTAVILSLYNLGAYAFQDFDEATYARVFHESLVRQDFINFTFLGQSWLDKPPLYFWLSFLPASLFGETEFSLRLPSALLTIFSILLIYKISINITKDKTISLISTLILLSMGLFLFAGRQLRLDVPVTFFILFSIYAFLTANQKSFWFLIFTLSLSGAILTKSIIGLLIFPIIIIHSYVFRDWWWTKSILFWLGLLIAVLLVLPWHIYQFVQYGNAFWSVYFFNLENRLGGSLELGQNPSILHQLWQFSLATFPWSFVFIFSVCFYFFSQKTKFQSFTLIASIFLFAIFLLPQNRLLYYSPLKTE